MLVNNLKLYFSVCGAFFSVFKKTLNVSNTVTTEA